MKCIQFIHIRRDMYKNCGKLYTMALRGFTNASSMTIVSSNKQATQELFVNITTPAESPYRGRIATLRFDWIDNLGQPAPVLGFGIGSLIAQLGGELFNFTQHSPNSYSVDVRFKIREGSWTLAVKSFSAAHIVEPAIKGPTAETSATMLIAPEKPIVKIGVPAERPITVRPVPITFDWVYTDGTPAPVQNFDLTDIDTDVGTLGNFAQVPGDASRYTADLTVPPNPTNTKATITVSANSAQLANASPAVLGPEEDTARTFEIAADTALVTITGADSVCVYEKNILDNDVLNDVVAHLGSDAGGAWTGVLESVVIGDYCYLVAQVQKFTQTVDDDGELVTPANPANFLSNAQAGAALVRVRTTNCQFEILKTYADITLAARSLEVNGSDVYFVEGSHYMFEDAVEFYDPDWRQHIGYVRKITHPSSTIQTVGLNWRSASPADNPDTETTDYFYGIHGATVSPMAIENGTLHMMTGYGNFDGIAQPLGDAPVKRIGNHQWIQYDDQINQRLSEVVTNGRTPFEVLKDIAIITHSVLGFKNDTFFLRPREQQTAVNGTSGITATQRTITATDLNWGEFPSEGWLFIDGELIQHTGANSNGQFLNVVRGAEGTPAAAYTGAVDITFVDHVLSLNQGTLEMPIHSIVRQNDNRQFYNRIRCRYGGDNEEVLVEDSDSIAENGPRTLDIDVPLDKHQEAWAVWLAESYLARFKDIQQILNVTLKPSLYLKILDIVYLKIPERMHLNGIVCQVLEVRHNFRHPPTTAVQLVTL